MAHCQIFAELNEEIQPFDSGVLEKGCFQKLQDTYSQGLKLETLL